MNVGASYGLTLPNLFIESIHLCNRRYTYFILLMLIYKFLRVKRNEVSDNKF